MQTEILPRSASQRRYVTISIVLAFHLVAIYGLLLALSGRIQIPTPSGPTIIDVFHNPAPPPQPGHTVRIPTHIPMPFVPKPQIPIDNRQVTTTRGPITSQPGARSFGPITQVPVLSPPLAIAATHTIPIYPPIAVRLNEEGSVSLTLSIDQQGNVVDARVIGSSGFEALDVTAVSWVKSHWRYQPALRNGAPIPSSTTATVTFRLMGRAE